MAVHDVDSKRPGGNGPDRTTHLIDELTAEAEKTRTLFERLPEEHLTWKPHPKSMTLGQLALHTALLPLGIATLVEELTVELPNVPLPQPSSRTEVLAALEQSIEYARIRLAEWREEGLSAQWTLTAGGDPILSMTRGDLLRTLMFNHVYHHRGQLTVYLRMLDVAVPGMYGPTADEAM